MVPKNVLSVIFLHTVTIGDMLAASHCGYIRLIMLLFFFLPKSQGDAFPELKKNPQMVGYVWGLCGVQWGGVCVGCELCTMYTLLVTTIASHN